MYEKPKWGGEPAAQLEAQLKQLFDEEGALGAAMDEMLNNAPDRAEGERRALAEYAPRIEAIRRERAVVQQRLDDLEK
jgi:hypothetical protein